MQLDCSLCGYVMSHHYSDQRHNIYTAGRHQLAVGTVYNGEIVASYYDDCDGGDFADIEFWNEDNVMLYITAWNDSWGTITNSRNKQLRGIYV